MLVQPIKTLKTNQIATSGKQLPHGKLLLRTKELVTGKYIVTIPD
jgi:hypothetical protein